MNQPITVTNAVIAGSMQPVVNGRDLHARLGINQRFNEWIAKRISQYDFRDGDDFYCVASKNTQGPGRTSNEYTITLRMAKELAMVENNEQGRAVRRWFIDLEEKQLFELRLAVLKSNPLWWNIGHYLEIGLNGADTAKLCNISKETLRKHRRRMEALGLVEPPESLAKERLAASKAGFTVPALGGSVQVLA